jgi:putative transposase
VRYRFIQDQKGQFRVSTMCRLLEVSVSGYYAWRSRPESRRSREDRVLLVHIRSVFTASDSTYGSPRIHKELKESGIA